MNLMGAVGWGLGVPTLHTFSLGVKQLISLSGIES